MIIKARNTGKKLSIIEMLETQKQEIEEQLEQSQKIINIHRDRITANLIIKNNLIDQLDSIDQAIEKLKD